MIENLSDKILIVDDETEIATMVGELLSVAGYECFTANSGEAALKTLRQREFGLVVTDIMMPGMSGIDLLIEIKKSFPNVAVIMVTGLDDRKMAIHTLELGAYGYIIKPFNRNEILINVVSALERRRLSLFSHEYETSLKMEVEERTRDVHDREEEIIFRLIAATRYRDDETGAHVKRIGLYAAEMARGLGWSDSAINDIRLGAPMHDLGKIGVPDEILLKKGKLEPAEFEIIKTHPKIGFDILDGSKIPLIQMAAQIALSHHEKWDGSGYLLGLSGEDIPEAGRVVAIVDVYDALTHDRVYRKALPEEKALSIIASDRGRHFDPPMLDCFMDLLPQMRDIRDEVRDSED
ncbi:MAG: HD domain-containing phosphohydrolase [Pseudomonadota bacterium]